MNPLVDLLIDNIGAVIVIAVAAISLLGKMKLNVGNPTGTRPMRPMPSFGGGPGERELPTPDVKPQRDWESGEGITMEGETGRVRASVPPYSAVTTAAGGAAASHGSVTVNPPAQMDGAAGASLAPDKEDLRRAVLWAEILGPPRAKRPHGR